MIALAVAALATSAAAAPERTWSDAHAYCRAVGTIDKPDRRYVGPRATAWMRRPWTADGPATGPDDKPMAIAWRCADGVVKTCAYDANAPCDRKANVSRRPTADSASFCRENPGSDSVPLAASGHDTIYDWSCTSAHAVAGKVLTPVDRHGYATAIWRDAAP